MELRHLRYFIALAEELHFGRAAARLHVVQPALSQQIRRLEEELQLQLFQRTKRKVVLTEAGAVLLEKARLTLAHAADAVSSAKRASRGEFGELIVGFVGSAAFYFLPKLLQRFRASFPEVRLVLRELTTTQQLAALKTASIRIGLLRPPISDSEISTETLARESWMLAMPRSHRLRDRTRVALDQVAQDPFIATPRSLGPGLYDQALGLCMQAGFSPRVVQEAIQMSTIVSLVAAGIGVALVPSSVKNLGIKNVLYKPLRGSPSVDLAAAWRRADQDPILRNWLSVIRDVRGSSRWNRKS
jgi:DNA-binding transcriptional LysR family regulator